MANMTKEQIRALGSAELRAIVRSTVSTSSSRYSMELLWARDEIDRRNRLRNAIKDAIVKCGGYITAPTRE